MKPADDKPQRNIFVDEDHKRGCEGRNYSCTCGYDERMLTRGNELEQLVASRSSVATHEAPATVSYHCHQCDKQVFNAEDVAAVSATAGRRINDDRIRHIAAERFDMHTEGYRHCRKAIIAALDECAYVPQGIDIRRLEERGLHMPPGILARLIDYAMCKRCELTPDDSRYLAGIIQELCPPSSGIASGISTGERR